MNNSTNIRTDLALEVNEEINKTNQKDTGIEVSESIDPSSGIRITKIEITNKNGERALNREKGTYITIEDNDCMSQGEHRNKLIDILSKNINQLMLNLVYNNRSLDKKMNSNKILVIGLGNRNITADALGPFVTDRLNIRPVNSGIKKIDKKTDTGALCAISPGVLADTGMETAEIIKGIISRLNPDIVIVVDALAARNIHRLNSTIQLSDRGITPGSGVGNHRVGLNKHTLGVPVLAIGVPTVIDAVTIVSDYLSEMLDRLGISESEAEFDKKMFEEMGNMFVTGKDVDSDILNMSEIIAESINMLEDHYTFAN
ncbi:MAG: GPR endopeptidase [Lachnospira sp.]